MVQGRLPGVVHLIARHLIEKGARRRDPSKGGAQRRTITEADVFDVIVEHGDVSDEAVAALASESADDVSRQTAARRRLAAIEILSVADASEFGPAGAAARDAALAVLRKRPGEVTSPPAPARAVGADAMDAIAAALAELDPRELSLAAARARARALVFLRPVREPAGDPLEVVPGLAELQRALAQLVARDAGGRPTPLWPHHIAAAQLELGRRRVPITDITLRQEIAAGGLEVSYDAVRRRRRWLSRNWPAEGGRPLREWLAVEAEGWIAAGAPVQGN